MLYEKKIKSKNELSRLLYLKEKVSDLRKIKDFGKKN